MRCACLLAALVVIGCGPDPAKGPSSFSKGSDRAAKAAAQDIVNECRSRDFNVVVERGEPLCRGWIHYKVSCDDDTISNYATLACDEKDDFCTAPSEVCQEDDS